MLPIGGIVNGPEAVGFTRVSDVTAERVEWLWPGRLPLGKLAVLDGDPSLGKSTLCIDIAARVTTGAAMPDDSRGALTAPADVVLLTAEDGLSDTVRPRADAAGADVSRLHVFEAVPLIDPDTGDVIQMRPPSLPGDLDVLERFITSVGAVLVVVDVLTAFLASKVDSYRDQDVRGALMPLARMAERTRCAVLVLRHLSKTGGANAVYRGGGSIGIIGAARAGLLVGRDPEDNDRRVLAVTKSNLAAIPPALAYHLVPDDENGCARVEWLGETSHTADQLVATPDQHDHDHTDAATVLAEVLADGPLWVKEALDRMAAAGFSRDQAKRAKAKLGARAVKYGKPGDAEQGWRWELPEERTKGAKSAPSENRSLRSVGAPFGADVVQLHPNTGGDW